MNFQLRKMKAAAGQDTTKDLVERDVACSMHADALDLQHFEGCILWVDVPNFREQRSQNERNVIID